MVARVPSAPRSPSWLEGLLSSRLLAALAYPRTVERYAQLFTPTVSRSEVHAEVIAVRRETPTVATLVLRPGASFQEHRAGQYVALTAEIRGVLRTRHFSLSSAPGRPDGLVDVTIKERAGGLVTPELVRNFHAGKVVTLSQPQGDFVLPDPLPSRLLFVSGGSGITPVMAMLRSLLAAGYAGQIVFLHYARSRSEVIFREELERLGAASERLTVRVETEEESARKPELSAGTLASLIPDFEGWEAFVCGPEPLLQATRAAFAGRGAEERVHSERFSLEGAGSAEGRVEFRRSSVQTGGKGKPLLVLAEEAGLKPRSGCRAGICHTCVCRKVSGTTRDLRTGALSTEADVDIRLCVNEPVGDVTLDL